MRKQIDLIKVEDENDKYSMDLARTSRLAVRQERLNAEKTFDAKRSEVQNAMLSFKTEDSLWLKAKQVMQIITKEQEDLARWKEETAKRFEIEQKELKIKNRELSLSKFIDADSLCRTEFENMSDDTFNSFIKGIEKTYNDKIEAEKKAEAERIENDRLDKVANDRRFEIAPFAQFNKGNHDLRAMSNEDYSKLLTDLKDAKKAYEAQQEEQRIENERLKKEAELKEKALAKERKEAEAEANKLKAELKRKQDAEDKAKAEAARIAKEEIKRAQELAKAPIKDKMKRWVDSFELPETDVNNDARKDIEAKFKSFKNWAAKEIQSI